MSDYFVGEIRLFGGAYAPEDWHICDGTTLKISDYQLLYAVIGVTYGGDGTTTFKLPDLRGRLPMGQGTGPGLTTRVVGNMVGSETVALTSANLPSHTHVPYGTSDNATTATANGQLLATTTFGFYADGQPPTGIIKPFAASAVSTTGQGAAHPNIMPCVGMNYIIALQGLFPPRPN